MSPRFLVDAQLPPALVRDLRGAVLEARHVARLGAGFLTDQSIWDLACKESWTIVSKDADFVQRARLSGAGAAVAWIRLGNTTAKALWASLSPVLPDILDALKRGERLVEVI